MLVAIILSDLPMPQVTRHVQSAAKKPTDLQQQIQELSPRTTRSRKPKQSSVVLPV